jgi:hypothetical protein
MSRITLNHTPQANDAVIVLAASQRLRDQRSFECARRLDNIVGSDLYILLGKICFCATQKPRGNFFVEPTDDNGQTRLFGAFIPRHVRILRRQTAALAKAYGSICLALPRDKQRYADLTEL